MKELEKKIRNAIPRLMELEEGCYFNLLDSKNNKFLYKDDEGFAFINSKGYFEQVDDDYFHDEFEVIIGKNIMLNDVLEYLNSLDDCNFLILSDGCFWEFDEDMDDYFPINNETFKLQSINGENTLHWDLSKPFLKDQTKEILNFLNSK